MGPLKQVTQFTYLGATIKSDGKIDKETNVRIGKATDALKGALQKMGVCGVL